MKKSTLDILCKEVNFSYKINNEVYCGFHINAPSQCKYCSQNKDKIGYTCYKQNEKEETKQK